MNLHTTPGTALAIQARPPSSPAPAASWVLAHKSAPTPAFPYDALTYIPLKTKNKYKLCFHIFSRHFQQGVIAEFSFHSTLKSWQEQYAGHTLPAPA